MFTVFRTENLFYKFINKLRPHGRSEVFDIFIFFYSVHISENGGKFVSTEKRNENFMLKQSRYSKGKKNVKQYSKIMLQKERFG